MSTTKKYEAVLIKKAIEYFKDVGKAEVNDKRDDGGKLAIHIAAGCGNLPEVGRLLSIGADIHSKDKFNNTPLHEAATNNRGDSHFDMIKMLLELGAEVNAQNTNGTTPLHFLTPKANVKTFMLLLNFGAEVNTKNRRGHTPLSLAIDLGYENNLEVYKLLVDHGSVVDNLCYRNMTPLHFACESNSFKLVKFLIKVGANVNSLNFDARTPLMMVLKNVFLSHYWVRLLIKYSDVNIIDRFGKNILCFDGYEESKKFVGKIIVSHIAKLQVLDFPVLQELYKTISNRSEYREYFRQCIDELLLAKSSKLKNCWVTYYNLLFDSKRKLKNYSGNRDLVKDFENSDCLKKFPVYGAEMIKKVGKGIETRKLFDKSSVELSDCLPIFNPIHLTIKDILDCLTFKDYNRLIAEV